MNDVYDSFLEKYISEARNEGAKEYRAETIVTLQEYVKFVQDSLQEETEKAKKFKTPTLVDVNDKAGMIIGVLSFFAKEANQKLITQYKEFAEETISITNVLANRIKQDEQIEADYEGFV